MTVVQRFGSALNLNVHFHVLALDGVYARGHDGRLVFHRDLPPTNENVERLVEQIAEAADKTWAALLYRVFGVAGWRCPQCGGAMRLRAHSRARSTERILEGLEHSARGPPVGQMFGA